MDMTHLFQKTKKLWLIISNQRPGSRITKMTTKNFEIGGFGAQSFTSEEQKKRVNTQ